jgi:hypothetical protein
MCREKVGEGGEAQLQRECTLRSKRAKIDLI